MSVMSHVMGKRPRQKRKETRNGSPATILATSGFKPNFRVELWEEIPPSIKLDRTGASAFQDALPLSPSRSFSSGDVCTHSPPQQYHLQFEAKFPSVNVTVETARRRDAPQPQAALLGQARAGPAPTPAHLSIVFSCHHSSPEKRPQPRPTSKAF